jgi:hypothetical protein
MGALSSGGAAHDILSAAASGEICHQQKQLDFRASSGYNFCPVRLKAERRHARGSGFRMFLYAEQAKFTFP